METLKNLINFPVAMLITPKINNFKWPACLIQLNGVFEIDLLIIGFFRGFWGTVRAVPRVPVYMVLNSVVMFGVFDRQ